MRSIRFHVATLTLIGSTVASASAQPASSSDVSAARVSARIAYGGPGLDVDAWIDGPLLADQPVGDGPWDPSSRQISRSHATPLPRHTICFRPRASESRYGDAGDRRAARRATRPSRAGAGVSIVMSRSAGESGAWLDRPAALVHRVPPEPKAG